MEVERFKATQRQMWEKGDYRPVGHLLEPAALLLVKEASVRHGDRVLDVGTGSGSVAVAAARAGAEVVGVDITDAWFDEAHRSASEAGVDVDLRIGDAEALPVGDASFDVVLSSFGAIFAPRHELVVAELVRVCRVGGTIAFTAWTPEGASYAVASTLFELLPPPPEFVAPSILWGDPNYVRDLFTPHGVTLSFERPTLTVTFRSGEEFESFLFESSGVFIAARQALQEKGQWEKGRALVRAAVERTNEAEDDTYRVTWDFLLTVATKAG